MSHLKQPFNFNYCISTVFGVGQMKWAPGTWGSMIGVLGAILLSSYPLLQWMILVAAFILGLICITPLIQHQSNKDPGYIVIDEFVGQMMVFTLIPNVFLNPVTYLFGFLFFRLFDIFKPWPASYFDQKIHSAFGIMMDDIVAGLFSLISLLLIQLYVF